MSDKSTPPDDALARLVRWLFPPRPVPKLPPSLPPSLPPGMRLAAPPAPKVVSPPGGTVVFRECPTCFCLLMPERSEKHAAWHKGS